MVMLTIEIKPSKTLICMKVSKPYVESKVASFQEDKSKGSL